MKDEIKRDLSISGKVEIPRSKLVKIIAEWLKQNESLTLEKAVAVDEEEKPVKFENLICYVHQAQRDKIIKDFDDPKKINAAVGISRPNYGVGNLLREILSDGEVHKLHDIHKEVIESFPKMTFEMTKRYLTRPKMTGQILISGDTYMAVKEKTAIREKKDFSGIRH